MDRKLFPSGDLFFGVEGERAEGPELLGSGGSRRDGTVVVHNNWIVGKHNKIQRFRNAGLWLEGAEGGVHAQVYRVRHAELP